MKKIILLLALVFLLIPNSTNATHGQLTKSTIKKCYGGLYGKHKGHWHYAYKTPKGHYFPTDPDDEIHMDPCSKAFGEQFKSDYNVEYYIESDDGRYELHETKTYREFSGKKVSAKQLQYKGFTLNLANPDTVKSGEVSDYNTLSLKLYYDFNRYKITYKYTGTIPKEVSDLPEEKTYKYDEEVELDKDATAQGYIFSGWTSKDIKLTEKTFKMPAKNITFTGSFKPAPSKYKVEHYQENIDDDSYTLFETQELEGNTNSKVNAKANTYEGFTYDKNNYDNVTTGTISGDNSLVLKLYYKRNTHKLTYKYTGDIPENAPVLPDVEIVKYGKEIKIIDNPVLLGYTFSGWNKEDFEMPNEDILIEGSFSISNDTKYMVEYYVENITNNNFSLLEMEMISGTTFSKIQYTDTDENLEDDINYLKIKEYEGFTFDKDNENNVLTGTILEDGSLKLKIYYLRNSYKVTYKYSGKVPENATALPKERIYKYEANVKVADDAKASKYIFSGWDKDDFKMPSEDVEIIGFFKVDKKRQQRDKIITIVGATTAVTATAGTSAAIVVHNKNKKKPLNKIKALLKK